jgi:hypothetical protein
VDESADLRQKLENYAHIVRATFRESDIKDKLSEADKTKLEKALDEVCKWTNPTPTTDEVTQKNNEFRQLVASISWKHSKSNSAKDGGSPEVKS